MDLGTMKLIERIKDNAHIIAKGLKSGDVEIQKKPNGIIITTINRKEIKK